MYDFDCRHVGKDLYRAKKHEEDIVIINEMSGVTIPVSLKAYGDGPLQLSTDKDALMFPKLKQYGTCIDKPRDIAEIFASDDFASLGTVNVMPLIYREKSKECNIMIFDFEKMKRETAKILYIDKGCAYDEKTRAVIKEGKREHPIYMFLNADGGYICEVRYGNAKANALQRGFWTHTVNAFPYFNSLTHGWISYQHNHILVQLFRLALNSTAEGHRAANVLLQEDIDKFRRNV